MSLPAQKSKNDYNKYLNSYLATLNQSIQNNDLVYNAVSANLAGDMMAVPQMPQDTRSVEDKLRDIENLKVQLNSQLMSLTDGKTAGEIVRELNDFEIQQAVQSFPSLYATLKPLWAMGVPSVIFVQALRNLSQKQDLTAGIEMNLQQGNANTIQLSPQQLQGLIDGSDLDNLMGVSQGLPPRQRQGLLSQISYVRQLLFDKGSLPDRIQQAREIESMTGEDQRIPASVQEFLESKGDFYADLNELNQAIADGNATDRDRTLKSIMDALTPPEEVVADMEDFESAMSPALSQKSERVRLEEEGVPEGSSKPKQRTYPKVIRRAQTQPLEERQARQQTTRESVRGKNVKRGTYRPREAEQGQAGAEETKGEVYQPPSGRTYRTLEQLAQAREVKGEPAQAQVFSGKAPKLTEAFQEGSDEDLLQRLTNKSDASQRSTALRELEKIGKLKIDGKEIDAEDLRKTGTGNKLGNPNNKTGYWERTNVFQLNSRLQQMREALRQGEAEAEAQAQPKSKGKGLRRMSGRGVSFNISEEPQTKPKSIKLKMTGVIEKEPSYVPFGRYAINKHKLAS